MSLKYNGKWHLPTATGTYTVGCTDIMTGPDVDGSFVRLFYPTDLQDVFEHHDKWALWIPRPKYTEGFANVTGFLPYVVKYVIAWAAGQTYVPVVMDATPAHGKFPVVVFSHGITACRTSFSIFCSEVASHGFVVAAIEHRDYSACLTYTISEDTTEGSENWMFYKTETFQVADFELRQTQLNHRILECGRALDLLHELHENNIKSPVILSSMDLKSFQGKMDFTNPALAGHSFGSATLLRTLAVDKRFKIGLAMDSWMWPLKDAKELYQQVDQPLLFINMEAFQTKPNLRCMKGFAGHQSGAERRVVTIRGTVHLNQSDITILLPSYLRRFAGAHSTTDPYLAMELNNKLAILFLCKHNGLPVNEAYAEYINTQQSWFFEGINFVE